MLPTFHAWGYPIDLTLALLLGYVAALWAGGWTLEHLARAHFRRALRQANVGFSFDAELDRYECPQGELLTLQTFDDRNKLALYKAPAASCNVCPLKSFCTPHDEGRHIYRSLADFHETDVGRFHRALSFVILALAVLFSSVGVLAWWNRPGEWLLVLAASISLILLWKETKASRTTDGRAVSFVAEPDHRG